MTKNIKSITNPKLRLEVLTSQEVKKIHDATLWIIEHVGVRFPSQRALDIWASHGAEVDAEKMIVRARPHLIEEALKKAPPAYPWRRVIPSRTCPWMATMSTWAPMAAAWN